MKNQRLGIGLALLLMAAGLALIYYGMQRPVTIQLNGQAISVFSRAVTVQGALKSAGIKVKAGDSINPGIHKLIGRTPVISVKSGKTIRVWTPDSGLSEPFVTTETLPGNILQGAGVRLFPGDRIRWNGALINAGKPLPGFETFILQMQPAIKINLSRDGVQETCYSAAATVVQALWENGITISKYDRLIPSGDTPVVENMDVTLNTARPVTILVGDQTISSFTAAGTTGEALLDAGVILQDLDFSIPAESEPLPDQRTIQVVRVSEEILLQQTSIPFETEYVQDPEVGLDQESTMQSGESGIKISSQRVRFEDGLEVSRSEEKEWIARQPVTARIGYGSKIIPYTLETGDGVIEYYRAIPVYATSYSPCRSGVEACLSGTSLGLPVKKGVIGVTYEWFLLLGGHEVYVPGYGRAVIADVGGGIDGKRWIDLGFSDDDYVHWSQDTTLYFLTPAPADVPWILP